MRAAEGRNLSLRRSHEYHYRDRDGPRFSFSGRNLPGDRSVKRVHLVFTPRSPLPVLRELDEAGQRKALAGDLPGAFVLSIDLPEARRLQNWHVLDTNPQLGWHWVYMLLEDEQGDRWPGRFGTWQVGEENDGWNLRLKLDREHLLVLPQGYTP